MNKEEINWEKSFDYLFVEPNQWSGQALISENGDGKYINAEVIKSFIRKLLEPKLENNTLTIEIPKGYKTLDTRELSEGERHWIEVDLIEESKMCKIRQPHDGIDCPCNREVNKIYITPPPEAPDLSNVTGTIYKTHSDLKPIIDIPPCAYCGKKDYEIKGATLIRTCCNGIKGKTFFTPLNQISESDVHSWGEKEALNIGMCAVGCDCGHCNKRREVVNRIEDRAYQRAVEEVKDQLYDNIKRKYNGFGGVLGFTHGELNELINVQALKGEEIK